MSTANKLTYLNGTKQAIKQAINEDFEVIDDNTTFRKYADEISSNNTKYKDLIPKETTNATNTLDISNSSGLDKALVTQYGNTYQETTTGKNLLNDYDLASRYHISSVEGNLLTTTSSSSNYDTFQPLTKTQTIQLNQGTEYYVSLDMRLKSGTYSNPLGGINLINLNGSSLSTSTEILNSSMTSNFQRYCYKCTASLTTNERIGIMIQLRAGASNAVFEIKNVMISTSSDTTYEKYTGKNPAPNPDYPQTITNVTGTDTIKINGKNLFDKNNANILEAFINASGVITSGNGNKTLYIACKSDTTYTISKTADNVFRAGTTDQLPSAGLSINNKVANDTASTITITTGASAKYLVVFFKNASSTNTEQQLLDSIQIEQGSATTYEAYKEQSYTINLGNIELCKILDYKDRIYPLNGKWYLHKEIGKVVLNGSEKWNSETAYTGYYRYILLTLEALNTNNGLNNRFTQRISQAHGGYEYLFIQANNGAIHIQLLQSRLSSSSIADFKTWLSNNNVTVYYVLATPTTTEITESNYPTLYNQLNNIKLFEGVNHITMTNESGLDVEFDIQYYKDWKLD